MSSNGLLLTTAEVLSLPIQLWVGRQVQLLLALSEQRLPESFPVY